MPKKVSIKQYLKAFYYIDTLYWYKESTLRNKLLELLYIYFIGVIIFGNVNYLYLLYQNGTTFKEVAYNMSWLISILYALFAIHKIKRVSKIGHYLIDACEKNTDLRKNYKNVQHVVEFTNLIHNNVMVYLWVFLATGYLLVEFEKCDDHSKRHACGFIFPTYLYINIHNRPYRDLYNLASVFLLAYVFVTIVLSLQILYFAILYLELLNKDVQQSLKISTFIQLRALRLQKLKEIHQQQIVSNKLWKILMEIYRWPLLLQYVTSVVNIPLILISSLNEFKLLSLAHVSIYIAGTFACGFFAEKMYSITEHSRHKFFYACPWDGDLQNTKYLILMNLNSNHGFKIMLGHFGSYSNEVVLKIFKWSYSILMVYVQYEQLSIKG